MDLAVFGAFVQVVSGKLLDMVVTLAGNEYGEFGGFKKDLEKLDKLLIRFKETVQEYEVTIFKYKAARHWYDSVKFAVNDADRILEEADGVLHPTQPSASHHHHQVCSSFPSILNLWNRRKLSERIASLLQKFENLDVEMTKLDLKELDLTLNRETISSLSEVEKVLVHGRDDEKEEIVNILIKNLNDQSSGLNVYAIIGLGGIGKTTLAQLIYNDTRVIDNFELRSWVWVSQNFDVKKVMEKIIETVCGKNLKFESLETTQNHLNKLLNGKKFLIVLDDVWNEDQGEWNKLKSPLNFGAAGSCILLTTREVGVASIARARDQHKLPVLSKNQCWRVFKESAYFDEKQENGELVAIGKQIAEKCGGMPLAAKSLGGSLQSTRDKYAWELVRDSRIWDQPGDILPALKLSLDRLETHSRNCFTFCCVFPKGYKMKKEELIQLWMANDFIPSHPILELEDMGNKFYNDLVVKSLFQISYNYMEELVVTMHDLMHDLCLYFRKECFCLEGSDIQISPQIQHLSVRGSNSSFITNLLETLSTSHSSLCTCIFLYTFDDKKINFNTLNCLRVLNLMNTGLKDLPVSIGNVKDLKYLNLCWNDKLTHLANSIGDLIKLQTLKLSVCVRLTQLPEGITRLVNLRHLDLSGCRSLTHLPDGIGGLIQLRHLDLSGCEKFTHLPDGIGGLIQLRHLDLSGCEKLTHLPDGIGGLMNLRHLDLSGRRKLTDFDRHVDKLVQLPYDITGLVKIEHMHLQCCHQSRQLPNGLGQLVNLPALTLDSFVVGRADGHRITELKRLNGLKGELEIKGLENVRDATEAAQAMLKEKKKLSSLSLVWRGSGVEAGAVLEALEPPERLNKELVVDGYRGSVFPRWMQLLHNLVCIQLRGCINCERLPPLGQLVHLRYLSIKGMRSLKCIGTEFYGSSGGRTIFPSLVSLTIEDMPKLEEWENSQQTEACPCLEGLFIERCESLKSLPECLRNLSNLQVLDIRNCEQLELSSEDFWSVISLDELYLTNLPKLTSFPALQHFSKLKRLTIRGCKNVISLGPQSMMQNPTVLHHLFLDDCEQLELSSANFQHLSELRRIHLSRLPKLTSLPQLQHLPFLEELEISRCKNLKVLPQWLQNITSLKTLEIKGCGWGLEFQCAEDTFQHIPKVLIRSNSFVVGGEDGQRITELKLLNGLEGELSIKGLENVRDATEATEAMLKEKNNLSSLFFIWGSSQGSDSSNDEAESPQSSDEAGAVLEALEPPESLNKELVIDGYGGCVFPTWMQLVHNLVRMELRCCINCERLPPLGQLIHLRYLSIKGMRSLKCIGTEFYGSSSGGSTVFPSLEVLVIEDMPKLEEWEDSQQTEACPCLGDLTIQRCKSLKSLPERLRRNLSNLSKLDIRDCDQLKLSSENFQSLISLKELCLVDLPKLTSFPALQHFSKLKWLTIRGCKNVISLGPQGMMQNPTTVLRKIEFGDCEQLELSSTDFQHLLKLKGIHLSSLPKLTSLPQLQHLPDLDWLYICNCKNLKILPHWLQNITSLQILNITECHADLVLRCALHTGEYWPFIKHIPEIIVEGEETSPSP